MEVNEQMTSEAMDTELNNAWSEDGDDWAEPVQAEANQPTQQEEVTPAPETGGDQTAANQPEQAPGNQREPYMITYEYMGERKQMDAAEAAPFIQKGMHYDQVRQERDQLRQYRNEADPALELVKSYAKQNGMDVGTYLDWCRKQDFVRQGMTERDAQTRLSMEKERAELDARQAAITAQEQAQTSAQAQAAKRQERIKADVAAFARAYPGVDPKDISQEVWAAVQQGESLTNAYAMHENKRLQAELEAKQHELDAERLNKANQAKTPGSLGGNVAAELDEIDRLWAEDD